jgi:hypothetical protein
VQRFLARAPRGLSPDSNLLKKLPDRLGPDGFFEHAFSRLTQVSTSTHFHKNEGAIQGIR